MCQGLRNPQRPALKGKKHLQLAPSSDQNKAGGVFKRRGIRKVKKMWRGATGDFVLRKEIREITVEWKKLLRREGFRPRMGSGQRKATGVTSLKKGKEFAGRWVGGKKEAAAGREAPRVKKERTKFWLKQVAGSVEGKTQDLEDPQEVLGRS